MAEVHSPLVSAAPLPVISLWQPWASLIFAAERPKKHETRSKPPPLKYVGGFVGIASTATFPPLKHISEDLHLLCMEVFGCNYNHSLPQGRLLGTVRLSGGVPTDQRGWADDDDHICGDWRPGRFAWPLCDVTAYKTPIPVKGSQGWWFYRGAVSQQGNER